MVMPFSRSRSFESIARSCTCSLARKVPVWRKRKSTRVVFPWSTCAMMAMLRICSRGSMAGLLYTCRMPQVHGHHHLAIQVKDLSAAERFYVEALGLRVLRRWPWEDGRPGERSVWLSVARERSSWRSNPAMPSALRRRFATPTVASTCSLCASLPGSGRPGNRGSPRSAWRSCTARAGPCTSAIPRGTASVVRTSLMRGRLRDHGGASDVVARGPAGAAPHRAGDPRPPCSRRLCPRAPALLRPGRGAAVLRRRPSARDRLRADHLPALHRRRHDRGLAARRAGARARGGNGERISDCDPLRAAPPGEHRAHDRDRARAVWTRGADAEGARLRERRVPRRRRRERLARRRPL